jgi:prepilin-type N-terminal cleavage/methylation domain-containing protein
MHLPHKSRASGFTLLEIIVAVSILVVLAGVIAYRSGGLVETSKSAKAVQLVGALKNACAAYQADIGSLPYEYAGYSAAYRQLSATQTMAGWKGPYIESPFTTTGTNPWGGTAHLYNTVTANSWITGFDTDGDGTNDVTAQGNMLYLYGLNSAQAQTLDAALDRGVPGTWTDTGKVRFVSNSFVLILIHW